MADWLKRLQGRFLVFDGPDGSGKTTQFRRFASLLREHGFDVEEVREPGGTTIGEQVREILLDRDNSEMTVCCEMLLYMASRNQLVSQLINPAIDRGAVVLADRFISSTLAYQGSAGGIPRESILAVGRLAIDACWPDCTIIFDVDQETAASRRDPEPDRMEQKGDVFHERVREGYLQQAEQNGERTLLIDASSDEDTVFARLLEELEAFFTSATTSG